MDTRIWRRLGYVLAALLLAVAGFVYWPQGAIADEAEQPAEEQVVLDEEAQPAEPEVTVPEESTEVAAPEEPAAEPEEQPVAPPEAADEELATEDVAPEHPATATEEPEEAVLEPMGGSSPANATLIQLGAIFPYDLSGQTNASDWYVFTLSKPGTISITASSQPDTHEVRYTIYKQSDLSEEVLSWYDQGPSSEDCTSDRVGLAAGTYYLEVYQYYGSKGTFKINFTQSSQWEAENNDTPARANTIKVGTRYVGNSIEDGYDEDWFVLTLSKRTTVAITYGSGHEYPDSDAPFVLELFSESQIDFDIPGAFDGLPILDEAFSPNQSTDSTSKAVTLDAGTYYIKVEGYCRGGFAACEPSYHFTVRALTSISGATVSKIADQPYTGSAIKPSPKVTVNGVTLKKGTDYTLSYKNNVKAGTATITITGKGNYTGTKKVTFKIVAPSVTYRVHVQTYGWQSWKKDGAMAGTSGKSKRLEGINIKLTNCPYSGGIQYRVHVQRIGWQGWRSNGTMAGTSGQSLRLEAIQIRLTGDMAEHYDVYYRVHAQHFGWMGWAKNGQSAGTAGYAYRLEAIEIRIVPKGAPAPGPTAGRFKQK